MQSQCYMSATELMGYVSANAHLGLSLDSLAKYMHMNRTYASEIFRRTTGQSFSECVVQARLEYAKQLLMSDLKMYAVACDAGFGSEVSFYRAFRRATGMTPREYKAVHCSQYIEDQVTEEVGYGL